MLKKWIQGRKFFKKIWYFVSKIDLVIEKSQEFAKFLRSLGQFIQTVKGQNNF